MLQDSTDTTKGYVVSEAQLPMQPISGGAYRVPIDRSVGCKNLVQRVFRYGPGRSAEMYNEISEDVVYVVAGQGEAIIDGRTHLLTPDTGLYVPPGARYQFVNPGPGDLVLVSVLSPQPGQPVGVQAEATLRTDGKLTTHESGEEAIPAGSRTFKFIINHRYGCKNVTQFVGFIPPSKAPFHTHTYEEVIYIIEGEGIAHVGDESFLIRTGSSIYLPPLLRHCLENPGTGTLRLLGVFCPAGDPGSKASEDNA